MNLSALDIVKLLPVIILAGGIVLSMLLIAIKRNHKLVFTAAFISLLGSFVSILIMNQDQPRDLGGLFLFDRFAFYYQGLILLSALVISIFSFISLRNLFPEKRKEEYYPIMMLATLGASMMVSCAHFISFFVSLELLTISLYSLISYYREQSNAVEAGLKYVMMAAMSSAFLLFGMALLYASTGTMDFKSLAEISTPVTAASTLMLVVGVGMMIVAVGFKLGLAPFHLWAADVYQGASAPITAFIATISKGAMLAVLLRFFVTANLYRFDRIVMAFSMIAVLSMLAGNLLALRQNNIKRMLAYSSIAHFGYLLIAILAAKQIGLHAATFYITAYVIAILIAFGLITLLFRSGSEASEVKSYRGMLWRKPLLATLLAIALLSLAGIPLTAGFMSKFMLLTAGVAGAKWLMVFSLVIGSVIGLFYYLRVIVIMMTQEQIPTALTSLSSVSSFTCIFLLTTLGVLMIWFGIYPAWIINLVTSLQLGSG